MYQSGEVDIRVLKDILGHEQLNTTQIYTHVSNEHMEEAMAANPLAEVMPPKRTKMKAKEPVDGGDSEEQINENE
jgi:site-specific recombinase XerD